MRGSHDKQACPGEGAHINGAARRWGQAFSNCRPPNWTSLLHAVAATSSRAKLRGATCRAISDAACLAGHLGLRHWCQEGVASPPTGSASNPAQPGGDKPAPNTISLGGARSLDAHVAREKGPDCVVNERCTVQRCLGTLSPPSAKRFQPPLSRPRLFNAVLYFPVLGKPLALG